MAGKFKVGDYINQDMKIYKVVDYFCIVSSNIYYYGLERYGVNIIVECSGIDETATLWEACDTAANTCHCGVWRTYGRIGTSNMHSTWCPLFVPEKEEWEF